MQVALPPPTPARVGAVEVGTASWYGRPYHGRTTSNGETYDMRKLTAAHLSLPFDTVVRVTNLDNGRRVDVRINDRGPFVKNRVIDLSRAAAERLVMKASGTAEVRLEVVAAPQERAAWTPTRTAALTEAAPCGGAEHGVQVGSFRDRSNAARALEAIAGRYAGARIVSAPSGGGTLYRVVVGAADAAAARRTLAEIEQDGLDGFLTRVPADAACLARDAS
jgi:rare lipoprotein A